jgi:hypothetical protein
MNSKRHAFHQLVVEFKNGCAWLLASGSTGPSKIAT